MAKAALRKAENGVDAGRVIKRALELRGWNLSEFAAAVERNERQCARWISGDEHPQMDTILAVLSLRQPMLVALAELAGVGVEIDTVIRIRRTGTI